MKYVIVSPYSGVLLEVTQQEDGSRTCRAIEPLLFRPCYATPLPVGQPVPY